MARLGRYELGGEIGAGGMATVYEAVDSAIGRRVALKVLTIPPYLSEKQRAELVTRLRREARAAGRLSHPHIVTVFDIGEAEGHHFIAMELLEGVTLRERLEQGPLSPEEAAGILEQLADALDYAHDQGILHRDLKPSNVMLLPNQRVKLTDFSVARAMDDATVTHVGTTVGSPAYLAPEQVRGEPATAATDRWALGVLLYEMLAGRAPFAGEHVASVLHQVAYDEAPMVPDLPEPHQSVLQRALAKDPAARFATGREMVTAFREAVGLVGTAQTGHLPRPEWRGAKGGAAVSAAPFRPRSRGWLFAGGLALLLAVAAWPWLRPPAHAPGNRLPVAAGPKAGASKVASVAPSRPPAKAASVATSPPVRVVERASPRTDSPPKQPSTARAANRASASHTPGSTPPSRKKRIRPVSPRRPYARRRPTVPPHQAEPAATVAVPTPDPPGDRSQTTSASQRPEVPSQGPQPPATRTVRRPGQRSRTAVALNDRAYRRQRAGRHRDAEPYLRQALRRDPNMAYAQYNLGWSLVEQGRAKEAIRPLQRSATRQPRRWEPHYRLGQAYERLGETEKARAAYARARELRSGADVANR